MRNCVCGRRVMRRVGIQGRAHGGLSAAIVAAADDCLLLLPSLKDAFCFFDPSSSSSLSSPSLPPFCFEAERAVERLSDFIKVLPWLLQTPSETAPVKPRLLLARPC